MNAPTTLALPKPRLAEGRFGLCTVLTDEALFEATGVRIAFTERTGGVSAGPYASLNLGAHVDDDPACVGENVDRVLRAFGADGLPCIRPRQVHGTRVLSCSSLQEASTLVGREESADGVAVSCADVGSLLCFADCVPVIGVSPAGSFFVAHAGWRGVTGRIVESAVQKLLVLDGVDAPDFSAYASRINIYIGPYIRACHFEVGIDVGGLFLEQFGRECVIGDVDEGASSAMLKGSKCHVDLGAALRMTLARIGVDASRVVEAGVCTVCDAGERFYSYRASGGVCGRHGAFAIRRESR